MAAEKAKNKGGRPKGSGLKHVLTQELGEEILTRLASGETLPSICRSLKGSGGPSVQTVQKWAFEGPKWFTDAYPLAREAGWHTLAEEVIDISDDATNDWMANPNNSPNAPAYIFNGEHVQRSKLRIDTRKWLVGKVLPKIYGDKIAMEHSGRMTVNIGQDDGEL